MGPFYRRIDTATVTTLGNAVAHLEGVAVGTGESSLRWSTDALESVAADLHGVSVVAAGTAGERAQMSVFDVGGSVDSTTVEAGAVHFEASIDAGLAELVDNGDAIAFMRGRRETSQDGSVRVVADAEVGRILVGPTADEALSVDAQPTTRQQSADSLSVATLAGVDGELTDGERAILQEQERLKKYQ